MSYQTDHAALEEQVQREQQAASDARALLQLFEKHRELVSCDASRNILLSYFNSEPMSLASLEEAIQNPNLRKQLPLQHEGEERAKLLTELKALTGEIPNTAKYQSTDEIRAKVDELRRKRGMQQHSPEELRKIIKDNTPVVAEDDLPAHMDRKFLLGLSAPGAFKRVCERYGVAAVTKRLNQR
jgi:hypothetical protein